MPRGSQGKRAVEVLSSSWWVHSSRDGRAQRTCTSHAQAHILRSAHLCVPLECTPACSAQLTCSPPYAIASLECGSPAALKCTPGAPPPAPVAGRPAGAVRSANRARWTAEGKQRARWTTKRGRFQKVGGKMGGFCLSQVPHAHGQGHQARRRGRRRAIIRLHAMSCPCAGAHLEGCLSPEGRLCAGFCARNAPTATPWAAGHTLRARCLSCS